MNCIETKENIEALLDNELNEALKERVENHLQICPVCRDLKEQTVSLSALLQMSYMPLPPASLDHRIIKSFRQKHAPVSTWQQIIFGTFAVPKPAFAALLILVLGGFWAAFQVGKIYSTSISISEPFGETRQIPVQMPQQPTIQTVVVEVPVIKEKTVTRTIYLRASQSNKNEKRKPVEIPPNSDLPLSSVVANNGYFTDVSLKGFQPTPEIGVKIIKGVKEDEK
ncbi:MAG: zf-HC2 domain-containing protein [Acidobacteriota bacterium]|nr:zf-HC2 domain-containing protein [Acidobacteriota bacterium]